MVYTAKILFVLLFITFNQVNNASKHKHFWILYRNYLLYLKSDNVKKVCKIWTLLLLCNWNFKNLHTWPWFPTTFSETCRLHSTKEHWRGMSLLSFPAPPDSCAQLAGNWLIWNWGQNLKYLNSNGQWEKDKEICLLMWLGWLFGVGWGGEHSSYLPGGRGPLEIFSDGMGTGCSFPHDPQLISSFLQKRRKLLNWDSAEGYEKKGNSTSYYIWKEGADII